MDRYIAYLQNEVVILFIVLTLIFIIVIDPLFNESIAPYCVENKSETIYEGAYGRIVKDYKVVRRC